MIISTGYNVDIPAYYTPWFMNRVNAGFIHIRDLKNHHEIKKLKFDPETINLIHFITTNPAPITEHIEKLSDYKMIFQIFILPYGRDILPNIPNRSDVIESVKVLSEKIGADKIMWRYSPIMSDRKYTPALHMITFEEIAKELTGYVKCAFIDFGNDSDKGKFKSKTITELSRPHKEIVLGEFIRVAHKYEIELHTCSNADYFPKYNFKTDGCLTGDVLENSTGLVFDEVKKQKKSKSCNCLSQTNIGYQYVNKNKCVNEKPNIPGMLSEDEHKLHDVNSPFIIGKSELDDVITEMEQISNAAPAQLELF